MQERKGLVLLLGVTGKTGYHIGHFLINKGYPVRVIVRKRQKLDTLFDVKQVAFESIIECEDLSSKDGQDILSKAFKPSDTYGPVQTVVSALGRSGRYESVETAEYTIQKLLIDHSVACKVEKYVLVSTCLITRQWHPIALLLNWMVPGVMHWKAKAENYLRASGLNYTIVRPGGLNGAYTDRASAYELGQGDTLASKGSINRATVAALVVDGLSSQKLTAKCTYECISTRQQRMTDYLPPDQQFEKLAADNDKNVVTANHNFALRFVKFTVLSALVAGFAVLVQKFK